MRRSLPPTVGAFLSDDRAEMHELGGTIQLAAEQLRVSQRAVKGTTTRVRTDVVETPVEEQVTLHGETVHVERQKLSDGKVTVADFQDKTIERNPAPTRRRQRARASSRRLVTAHPSTFQGRDPR